MTGGSITGNSAAYYGGGVYANGSKFSLSGSSEINNNNDYYGAGNVHIAASNTGITGFLII